MKSLKLSVAQLDLAGRRVFLRADLNVPLSGSEIADDARIRAIVPTLECCFMGGASVVIASHLGRPRGRDPRWSLQPVAFRLEELLGRPVALAPDCVGPVEERLAAALEPGQCMLLENLRFHPEEAANDDGFARELAKLAHCYVNDAFSVSHRAHASVVAITRFLRPAAAGLLMQRELLALARVLHHPRRPLALILGGARITDKIGILHNLVEGVDRLLIGGAMAFTFLKARGGEVGLSRVETGLLTEARKILEDARARGTQVSLPEDVVAGMFPEDRARVRTVPADRIPVALAGLDIGPAAIAQFREALTGARTIVWNGPMGAWEHPPFASGTAAIARAVAENRGLTVAGGTDTVAAIHRAGVADKFSYLSPSGTAFLEALEGRELPGVAALNAANDRLSR